MRLRGRRVLVTGAASGIGLAVARLFRQEGAEVAMVDRDPVRLEEASAEGAVPLACDVAEDVELGRPSPGQPRRWAASAWSTARGSTCCAPSRR